MNNTKEFFPLSWPIGYKKTDHRKDSPYRRTPGSAQDLLRKELVKLGAKNIIISSNARVQKDGYMYADAMGMAADPGVAVYFTYKTNEVVLCCDTYNRIWENVCAIGLTIQKLRIIERDGVSDFLNRSFTGFTALPQAIQTSYKREWWIVLGIPSNANESTIKEAYKIKSKMVHPDAGGSAEVFIELQEAYKYALKNINSTQ